MGERDITAGDLTDCLASIVEWVRAVHKVVATMPPDQVIVNDASVSIGTLPPPPLRMDCRNGSRS